MSFPLETFKLESFNDVAFEINHFGAEKLNELHNATLEVKKEYFNNCQIKMTNILNLLSKSNDEERRKLQI